MRNVEREWNGRARPTNRITNLTLNNCSCENPPPLPPFVAVVGEAEGNGSVFVAVADARNGIGEEEETAITTVLSESVALSAGATRERFLRHGRNIGDLGIRSVAR